MRALTAVLSLFFAAALAAKAPPGPPRVTVGDWIRAQQADESASARALNVSAGASVLSPAAGTTAAVPSAALFEPGENAVAYQVDEHIFGHENHVTGRNRDISVALEAQGDRRRVVVNAPNNKFKTDSGTRDGRVASHLGGPTRDVVVSSAWFPAAELGGLERGANSLPGAVTVKGHSAAVTLTALGDGKMVRVEVVTSFDGLGLPPPALGPFGLLGEVHQPLTLSAQIQLDKVEGLP